MYFDDDLEDDCWIYHSSWDILTQKKHIRPGKEKVQEYLNMEDYALAELVNKLDKLVKKGLDDGGRRDVRAATAAPYKKQYSIDTRF